MSNAVTDCDTVLQRASWLPSYDTWVKRLPQLEHIEPLHYWSVRHSWMNIYEQCPWNDTFVNVSGVPFWDDKPVVRFPRMVIMGTYLINEQLWDHLHLSLQQQEVAHQLHSRGPFFLYGLLFRSLFTVVHPTFQPSMSNSDSMRYSKDNTNTAFSIALHSRHRKMEADPQQIHVQNEMKCLQQLITPEHVQNRTCVVYVMSDRSQTLDMLERELHAMNCSLHMAANRLAGVGSKDEHGPWAGVGFFQDLVEVSRARDAVIKTAKSTSSCLMAALVEHDRSVEHVMSGQQPLAYLPTLLTCVLPF
jgi:hypothetical protein